MVHGIRAATERRRAAAALTTAHVAMPHEPLSPRASRRLLRTLLSIAVLALPGCVVLTCRI